MIVKKDYLNREKDKVDVLNIIRSANSRRQNLSFAIDGRWGSGKSYFIDLIYDELSKDNFVFKYDSWDNDYYDDPLIGMLDSIKDQLNRMNSIENTLDEMAKGIIKKTVSIITSFLDNVIVSKIGIKPFKAVKSIKKYWDEYSTKANISDDFNPYNKIKATKQLIVASMNKLAEIKPIIFIVDEIDRCLPTYTLKIIERIHHISESVNRCVTIFSVDTKQLQRIIELVYNKQEDTVKGYLRKIIDFTYSLGNGELSIDFFNELEDYRSRFGPPIKGIKEEEIEKFINYLFKGIEIRVVLRIINNAKYAHDLVFGNHISSVDLMCAELMLAWATKEYGNEMLTDMGKEMLSTSLDKKPFLEYISQHHHGFSLTYYDNFTDRKRFTIFDLKSLMAFFVVRHNNYSPHFLENINSIPPYVDRLLNDYLSSLIKIKC